MFPADIMPRFETAFTLAIQHGGLEELDYQRPEGQSYNPAPARIAQIAINDAQRKDPNTIVTSLLIFVSNGLTQEVVAANFNSSVADLYAACCKGPQPLLLTTNIEANILLACAWLDRLRHLHLAPESNKAALHDAAIGQTDEYIQLVRGHADSLVVLLEAWKTRASNRRS